VFYVLMQRISERQWPFKRVDAAAIDTASEHFPSGGAPARTPPSPAHSD
jgi:hypothetical protein